MKVLIIQCFCWLLGAILVFKSFRDWIPPHVYNHSPTFVGFMGALLLVAMLSAIVSQLYRYFNLPQYSNSFLYKTIELILSIASFVITVGLSGLFMRTANKKKTAEIKDFGVNTTATEWSSHTERSSTYLKVRFLDLKGQEIEEATWVDTKDYRAMPNKVFPIRYSSKHPQLFELRLEMATDTMRFKAQ